MIQDVYTGSRIRNFSSAGRRVKKNGSRTRNNIPNMAKAVRRWADKFFFYIKRVFQLSDCKELKFEGLGH